MRTLITIFFIAALAAPEVSGLTNNDDATVEKIVIKGEKSDKTEKPEKSENPVSKAIKGVKDAITKNDEPEHTITVDDDAGKTAKVKKVVVVPEHDLTDDVENSKLLFDGTDKHHQSQVKKHNSEEPKIVASKGQGVEITKPDDHKLHAKITSTHAAPVKTHDHDHKGHLVDDSVVADGDQSVVTYEERRLTTSEDPSVAAEIARQTQQITDLEADAAERALLASEQALADKATTVSDNLAEQAYLRGVAQRSTRQVEDQVDDAYNASEQDLTQNEFYDAQARSQQGAAPPPLSQLEIDSNGNAASFVSVGGVWDKIKSIFGVGSGNAPTTTVTTTKATWMTHVDSTQASKSGSSLKDLFKFKAKAAPSLSATAPDAASLVEVGEEPENDDDSGETVVVPVASVDDE